MTTKSIGDSAESLVAQYLQQQGYDIIERNWRTRYCEIDIVAVRTGIYYFVEVKYRSSVHQGGGFAAITPKKLRQMNFAAEVYASRHPNTQLTLMAAAVDARGVVELIEIT